MRDPAKNKNAIQFNQDINVNTLEEDTILNFDHALSDIFNYITKYDFNISTDNKPNGGMRIFINNPKAAASTNFPYYPRNRKQ